VYTLKVLKDVIAQRPMDHGFIVRVTSAVHQTSNVYKKTMRDKAAHPNLDFSLDELCRCACSYK
jgi:hypothetical protein